MGYVQDFLFQTRCDFLFLDMFCLDPFVLVKRAIQPGQPLACFSLPDISQGSEPVPIPCLNQVDATQLPPVEYIAKRRPAKGVYINTKTDFLVGCDCTDGCLDRCVCVCVQLQIMKDVCVCLCVLIVSSWSAALAACSVCVWYRSKCSCHQLTVEATALSSGGPVDVSAGYIHKRLLTPLSTG